MKKIIKIMVFCTIIGIMSLSSAIVSAKDVLLKKGCSGEDVKTIQTKLKELGYFNEKVTGYYGDVTKNGVIQFQKDKNFSVDGVVGPATWGALVGNDTTSVSSTVLSSNKEELTESLKQGMSGELVKKAQTRLKELGYFSGNTTGYFGQITKNSVIDFQKSNGCSVDGVIGSATWNKLFGTDNVKSTERTVVSRGGVSREGTTQENVVIYAKNYLNVKYVWGGNTPSGFDCSGFVKYVYQQYGVTLNRVAADQARQGTAISKANLQLGDLVFFDTNGGHNYINHVGIYIGGGMFIHASSGAGKVVTTSLNDGFYENAYMSARRVLN